jgi:hypothetical protein
MKTILLLSALTLFAGCSTDMCGPFTLNRVTINDTLTVNVPLAVDTVRVYYSSYRDTTILKTRRVEDANLPEDSCRLILQGTSVSGGSPIHFKVEASRVEGKTESIYLENALASLVKKKDQNGKGDQELCSPIAEHIEATSVVFQKAPSRSLIVTLLE